ncbi:nucleotide-sugar transporter, partial [Mortierella sp. GBAus27b]
VPGAIYFFNNNLTFVLLSLMPAPTYVVLSNLKILTTGLFSYLFLKRVLATTQWVSLGILFLSTAVSQVDIEKGLSLSISLQAFLLMVLFCSLSATAAVFSEYVMKERFADESIHLQNMKLYMFGILFNGVTYLLTPAVSDQGASFFADLHWIHFFIILVYASLGLVTSAIIKFSGSITKVYASSMSMFFAALVSWLLLNDRLTVLFFVGCFGCCFALHLY